MPGGFPIGQHLAQTASAGISGVTPTTVTSGGSNNTKGSYSQLAASTAFATVFAIVSLGVPVSPALTHGVDIAVGGAGSEFVKMQNLVATPVAGGIYGFPINIAQGSRLAARSQCATGGGTVEVSMQLFAGAFTQPEGGALVDCLGFNTGTSRGADVVSGNNTMGSYGEIISSTTSPYRGFLVAVDGGTGIFGNIVYDVAIGAAASEVNIVEDHYIATSFSGGPATVVSPYIPRPIPVGSRVSIRASMNFNHITLKFTVYGVL